MKLIYMESNGKLILHIQWTPSNPTNVLQDCVKLSNLSDYRVLLKLSYRQEFFEKDTLLSDKLKIKDSI